MLSSFSQFTQDLELNEALITFARQTYPRFGHVVLLAGGAGSGKGLVRKKLLGIEGKVFDVDDLKSMAMKAPKILSRVKKEFGTELDKLSLKNPDDVFTLHTIVGDELNLPKKREAAFAASVLTAPPDRKPNIIFDVTLKDLQKVANLAATVARLGYPKENVHIVWVVNDISVAMQQNKERERVVPEDILINTHRGVNSTMKDLVLVGSARNYVDGDIYFAFNKAKIDTHFVKGGKKGSGAFIKQKDKKGKTISSGANYVQVKKSGQPVNKDALTKSLKAKLNVYTPNNTEW